MFVRKKNIKMLLGVWMLSLALFPTIAQAKEHGIRNEHLWINGKIAVLNKDTGYFHKANNTTYVPVRFISETLKYKVDWNKSKQQVTISNGKKNIVCKVNNKSNSIDTGKMVNDKVYVPIRFVSEKLGLPVKYIDGIIYLGKLPTVREFFEETLEAGQALFKIFENADVEAHANIDIDGDKWAELILLERKPRGNGTERQLNVYKYDIHSKSVKNILSVDGVTTSGGTRELDVKILSTSNNKEYAIAILHRSYRYEVLRGYEQIYIFNNSGINIIRNEYCISDLENGIDGNGEKVDEYDRYFKDGKTITQENFKKISSRYTNVIHEAMIINGRIVEDEPVWLGIWPEGSYRSNYFGEE